MVMKLEDIGQTPYACPELDNDKRPVVIPREEWGAAPPKKIVPMEHPIENLVINLTTDTPRCWSDKSCRALVKELQEKHMKEEGVSDIKYNFLVGNDGIIYEGRGWNAQSSKSLETPRIERLDGEIIGIYGPRLDIAFIGKFRTDMGAPYLPPMDMITAAVYLVHFAVREGQMKRYHYYHEIPMEFAKKDEFRLQDGQMCYKDITRM